MLILLLLTLSMSIFGIAFASDNDSVIVDDVNSTPIYIYDVEEEREHSYVTDFIISYNVNESDLRTDYSYKLSSYGGKITWHSFFVQNITKPMLMYMEIKNDKYGLYCNDLSYKYRICDSKGRVVYRDDYIIDGENYYTEKVTLRYFEIDDSSYPFFKGIIFSDWINSDQNIDSYFMAGAYIYKYSEGNFYRLVDDTGNTVRRTAQILEHTAYTFELVDNYVTFNGTCYVDEETGYIPFTIKAPVIHGIRWKEWLEYNLEYLTIESLRNDNIYVKYDSYIYLLTTSEDFKEREIVNINDFVIPGLDYYLLYYSLA